MDVDPSTKGITPNKSMTELGLNTQSG